MPLPRRRLPSVVDAVMQGGMEGVGFLSVLIVLLLIALVALAVTATVWLIRDMSVRRRGVAGRGGGQTSDP